MRLGSSGMDAAQRCNESDPSGLIALGRPLREQNLRVRRGSTPDGMERTGQRDGAEFVTQSDKLESKCLLGVG